MVAVVEEPIQQMCLHNVSWQTFEKLLDEMGESRCRFSYSNGDLEFMTISLEHENNREWLGHLILFVALEMKIPLRSGGSTTLKQEMRKVGLEPDKCFWIKNEKAMRGKKRWDPVLDPPPDLAVEIDNTRSFLDRLAIYAALEIPEIWHYDGKAFKVLILGAGGKNREKSKSRAFPLLPVDGLLRFIEKFENAEEGQVYQEFAEWLRTEVLPKKANGTGRKNGRK